MSPLFIFKLVADDNHSKSLATFPFKNLSSEEHQWVSTGISDTLIAKLTKVDQSTK